MIELVKADPEAQEQEWKRFLELAERLASSGDLEEQSRLKEELAYITFSD